MLENMDIRMVLSKSSWSRNDNLATYTPLRSGVGRRSLTELLLLLLQGWPAASRLDAGERESQPRPAVDLNLE